MGRNIVLMSAMVKSRAVEVWYLADRHVSGTEDHSVDASVVVPVAKELRVVVIMRR